jgi:L-alanine-DL-glutamate epimerase-like enolase superfamily enzyme
MLLFLEGSIMEQIKLEPIDLAALDVMAKRRGISARQLLHEIIRDTALNVILGRPTALDKNTAEAGKEGVQ